MFSSVAAPVVFGVFAINDLLSFPLSLTKTKTFWLLSLSLFFMATCFLNCFLPLFSVLGIFLFTPASDKSVGTEVLCFLVFLLNSVGGDLTTKLCFLVSLELFVRLRT